MMKKLLVLAFSTTLTLAGMALTTIGISPNTFAAAQRESGRGRIAPPAALTCDRDRLTSFTGVVRRYSRAPGVIALRVRTDEETTEHFTLRFPRREGASKHFLLNGEPFAKGDWKKIESKAGRLKPRMRVTVWVCSDETVPVVDWRAGERPSGVY
ncbi:MAG: hypothetical protein H7Z38_15035 [Rubrivivax sp.]|nr:hypothetical protein [Pyrinomonadaceae bacterium]